MPAATRPRRAAPLAPAERRAAIIEATIPLLRTHGLAVTSRQIAEAAGVAEGTLFSVFDDKESLIAAAVDAALDPASTVAQIAEIELDRPLAERLVAAVEVLQARFAEVWQLMAAVGPGGEPVQRSGRRPTDAADAHSAALAELVSPSAGDLRRDPDEVARAVLGLTLGCSHPAVVSAPLDATEIVDLLLAGLATRHHTSPLDAPS